MRAAALALGLAACASAPERPDAVRVAACQILVDGDREAAFGRIEAALAEAAAAGADLAVFPEACLFGWVAPTAHDAADPIPGPTTERLGALAREHGLMLLVGLAEKDGDALHNAAVLIDRDGALLLKHRKTNVLAELMDPPYTPAPDAAGSVAETRLGRIGVLICADTFVDERVAEISAGTPDLVLVPYGWAAPAGDWPGHGESLHAWIGHTATRTGAPVVGVDSVGALAHGPWSGFVLGGQSAISAADGTISAVLADRAAEIRVVDVRLR